MTSNNLTSNDIKQLLEKFYAGETTPAEEALLTQYFLSHPTEDGFEEDRRLFIAMAQARLSEPPADLEARIVAATCGGRRRFIPARAAVAAVVSVLLVVAVAMFFPRNNAGEANLNDNESIFTALIEHPDTILNPDTVKHIEPTQQFEPSIVNASRAKERRREAVAQAAVAPVNDSAQIAATADLIERMLSGSFSAVNSGMNQATKVVKAVDKTVNQIIR